MDAEVIAFAKWGKIKGDLSKQADLQNVLNEKATTVTTDALQTNIASLEQDLADKQIEINKLKTEASMRDQEIVNLKTRVDALEESESPNPEPT